MSWVVRFGALVVGGLGVYTTVSASTTPGALIGVLMAFTGFSVAFSKKG